MKWIDMPIVRRDVLGIAGATASGLIATSAVAADKSSLVRTNRYRAKNRGIELQLYRKRLSTPVRADMPVVLLAHGSTISALSSFDLQVPGLGRLSMMDELATAGYDVWALDFDGYGRSGWSGGSSNIADGVGDLQAAAAFIEMQTGQRRLSFYGQSSGALRVGALAMVAPDRVDRLALESFVWTGQGSPTLARRRLRVDDYRRNPTRMLDRGALLEIFTRGEENYNAAIGEAIIANETNGRGAVPSGTYLDMVTLLPIVDPSRLNFPVIIFRGEKDEIATDTDVLAFFTKLPNRNRQYCEFAGAGHGLILGSVRTKLWASLLAFLPLAGGCDESR